MTAVSSVGSMENDDGAGGGGVGGIGEEFFKIDGNGDDETGKCGTGDGDIVVVVSAVPVAIAEIVDGFG